MSGKIKAIGIDVSGKKLDTRMIFSDGITKSLQVGNNQRGIPSLVRTIKSYQEKNRRDTHSD